MEVFIERQSKKENVEFEGKAIELLKKLEINTEDAIIIKNGVPITLDDDLKNDDNITLLTVISGG